MSTRIHSISLPVDHLPSSITFYREGLGFDGEDKENHAVFAVGSDLMLVLFPRSDFRGFTELAGQAVAPRGDSEVILSYFASSRDEVDELLTRATEHGGASATAEDKPWGYAGYVTDPDGHIWEILYNGEIHATSEG